jgi:hypothetical protein
MVPESEEIMRGLGEALASAFAIAAFLFVVGPPLGAATVTIVPSKDNTLIESDPSASCGIGPLFAGETRFDLSRRIVLAFDVAGSVPPGSTITSAELRMNVVRAGSASTSADLYSLHRLMADWGESTSACDGGIGVPAGPGDATWTERFFPGSSWAAPGGDYQGTPSGSAALPLSGTAVWPSQPGMVADVQSWLSAPSGNFGWIVVGPEVVTSTARGFTSRESAIGPPSLHVGYTAAVASPPAVPDGRFGSPLLVGKSSPDGSTLAIEWDSQHCTADPDHHLVYGTGAGLPAALGGAYSLQGAVCDLGPASPFLWNGVPDPAVLDPATKLLWILVLSDDGATTEGSWGLTSQGQERDGAGAAGSSAQCGIATKSVSNQCGQSF